MIKVLRSEEEFQNPKEEMSINQRKITLRQSRELQQKRIDQKSSIIIRWKKIKILAKNQNKRNNRKKDQQLATIKHQSKLLEISLANNNSYNLRNQKEKMILPKIHHLLIVKRREEIFNKEIIKMKKQIRRKTNPSDKLKEASEIRTLSLNLMLINSSVKQNKKSLYFTSLLYLEMQL